MRAIKIFVEKNGMYLKYVGKYCNSYGFIRKKSTSIVYHYMLVISSKPQQNKPRKRCHKFIFKLFDYPIFRFWAYLINVLPETCRAQ